MHHLEKMQKNLAPFLAQDFHLLPPFYPLLLQFCETLSAALFQQQDLKDYPDFAALAFWLRKSHLHQMQQTFNQKSSSQCILMPRGLVFHFPPANIEAMFVYSWAASLLAGNANLIRIPGTNSLRFQKLLDIVLEILGRQEFTRIQQMTDFIHYMHEDELTAWISSKVDVRILWGGDATIEKLRKIPLKASAKDLAFPDRFSYAAIQADSFLKLTAEEKNKTVSHFFNDIFWFDQTACSSPRLIFWVGDAETIQTASQLFYQELQDAITQHHYEISLGNFLFKQTFIYNQSLTLPVQRVSWLSNELAILFLEKASNACRIHCGQGLLYHVAIAELEEIASFTTSQDQTLTYTGFSPNELHMFVLSLNGKGLTRLVPFGQALNFDVVWDGHDLLMELTQPVTLQLQGDTP